MQKAITTTPCFTPGTLIATSRGSLPVEHITPGTKVATRDNGLRRVYWVGRRTVSFAELADDPMLRPILIQKGALGDGRPFRNMLVSPSHRMLVSENVAVLTTGEPEALVAAALLIGLPGISHAASLGVSYLHLLCDRHQVIVANGAWTESFHPDDKVFAAMDPLQRDEILSLFPEVATVGASQAFSAARMLIDVDEQGGVGR